MSDKYIVSARKYRPATFRSVVGQKELTATLRSSITSGRLAQAYLFCGPRGVGKTSCARIFARAVNCLHPTPEGEACGECESCVAISQGNSYNLMELDAASNNGVDDIRQIIDQVAVPPQTGRYRVFVIDEVHMLTSQAFNAFLKTLEEPPSYAIFILATTEKHKVIPTILSRCQIYDFKRITVDDIVEHLEYVASQEGFTADRKALGVIARKADGAMRDALSIFDQIASACGGNLTYEAVTENLNVLDYDYFFRLVDDFRKGDVADALLLYSEVRSRGFDSLFFIGSLAQHVRDLMVAADKRTVGLLETPADVSEKLCAQASQLPLPWYYSAIGLLNDCDLQYRTASNKQLLVELTLIRLCQLLNPAPAPFDKPLQKQPLRPLVPAQHNEKASAEVNGPIVAEPQPVTSAQPSAAVQPARQQAPADEASGRQRRAVHRTFSLSDEPVTVTSHERQRQPFDDAAFFAAWRRFIDQNPDKQILVGAMRKASPVRTGEFEYSVMVQHPAQMQAFELSMAGLLEFLRKELHNDFLAVRAEVDRSQAPAHKHLPPQEFLKQIIADNPVMGKFLKEIEGEIV
ncbi:MAG: DNA polymerase III subunit gamma/tau [Bacteroidales bacterium]|nr:DNA polymerase III subunit gamma/tau [Bacteroidales bacterium]